MLIALSPYLMAVVSNFIAEVRHSFSKQHSTVISRPMRLATLRSLFEIIFLPHEAFDRFRCDFHNAGASVYYAQTHAAMGQRRAHRPAFRKETAFEIGMAGNDRCASAGIFVFPHAVRSCIRQTLLDGICRF